MTDAPLDTSELDGLDPDTIDTIVEAMIPLHEVDADIAACTDFIESQINSNAELMDAMKEREGLEKEKKKVMAKIRRIVMENVPKGGVGIHYGKKRIGVDRVSITTVADETALTDDDIIELQQIEVSGRPVLGRKWQIDLALLLEAGRRGLIDIDDYRSRGVISDKVRSPTVRIGNIPAARKK